MISIPNAETKNAGADATVKPNSPRRSRRKVFPFMAMLDLRQQAERFSRSAPTDSELFAGILSDTDILQAMQATGSQNDAVWSLNMCAIRDVRVILAGIPNPTVVEVGAFMGTDTKLYALIAGKVVAYEAGPSKARHIVRKC